MLEGAMPLLQIESPASAGLLHRKVVGRSVCAKLPKLYDNSENGGAPPGWRRQHNRRKR